jgi:mono/diheme cytochrome c family protein
VLDRGAWMVTSARHVAGRMFASHTGVWLDDTRGSMFHYQIDAGADRWQAQVAPVFQRVCAHCHLPDGEAGIDLSTVASWNRARGEIVHRVLETRTMPPAGTELSDADRNALAAWLGVKP